MTFPEHARAVGAGSMLSLQIYQKSEAYCPIRQGDTCASGAGLSYEASYSADASRPVFS
jgi:hypothetical protein